MNQKADPNSIDAQFETMLRIEALMRDHTPLELQELAQYNPYLVALRDQPLELIARVKRKIEADRDVWRVIYMAGAIFGPLPEPPK